MLTIDLPSLVTEFIPLLTVVALLMASIWVINRLLKRGTALGKEAEFRRQSFVLIVSIIGLAALIVSLPIASDNRSQLLTLYGLVLTAIITISSTTLASNMMAGLMLRSVKSFRPGDFIRVAEHFGRVTEQDLFHTEIQTEDSDLITLPNMFLATQPVRVIQESGTIISCEVSLGYDDAPATIEPLLLAAAEKCDLQDPFVQIKELGDFSIIYRVAGFLEKTRKLVSQRAMLRRHVVDTLHQAGVEVMSPTFMAQRPLQPSQTIVPHTPDTPTGTSTKTPDELIFDKAESAGQIEKARDRYQQTKAEISALEAQLGEKDSDEDAIKQQIKQQQRQAERFQQLIENLEKKHT